MRAKLTDAELVEEICIALKLRGPSSPSQVSTYLREHRGVPNRSQRVDILLHYMEQAGMVGRGPTRGSRNGFTLVSAAIPPGCFGTPEAEPAPEPPAPADPVLARLDALMAEVKELRLEVAGIRGHRERTPLLPLDAPRVGSNGR